MSIRRVTGFLIGRYKVPTSAIRSCVARFPSDGEAFRVPIFRPFVTLVCRIIYHYMYSNPPI